MRKFSATIIAAIVMLVIGLLWLNFQAGIMQRQKAEATELVRWHQETTLGLHQQRQNCSAVGADPCCWNNVAMQQVVIDLQFELECRRKNILNLCRVEETELIASLPR
jgi:hypothetical protein